jgi:hypothetical protein
MPWSPEAEVDAEGFATEAPGAARIFVEMAGGAEAVDGGASEAAPVAGRSTKDSVGRAFGTGGEIRALDPSVLPAARGPGPERESANNPHPAAPIATAETTAIAPITGPRCFGTGGEASSDGDGPETGRAVVPPSRPATGCRSSSSGDRDLWVALSGGVSRIGGVIAGATYGIALFSGGVPGRVGANAVAGPSDSAASPACAKNGARETRDGSSPVMVFQAAMRPWRMASAEAHRSAFR